MTESYRIKTSMEESLIKAAHACLHKHVVALRDLHARGELPKDPLELATIKILLADRMAHAQRLLGQMKVRAQSVSEDEDPLGTIHGDILAVVESMEERLREIELLEFEGRHTIESLETLQLIQPLLRKPGLQPAA